MGSALSAEGMAMREALSECRRSRIIRLVCESDSTQLVKAGKEVPLELYGIVADIVEHGCHFERISFRWISREKNSEADALAKQSLVDGEVLMAIT